MMLNDCKSIDYDLDLKNSAGYVEKIAAKYQDNSNGYAVFGTFRPSNLRCEDPNATFYIPVYT